MAENTSPQPSDSDKLAAMLAELEAERQRRMHAGSWTGRTLPILRAVIQDAELERQAQVDALAEHLRDHPNDPKNVDAYDWIEFWILDPKPVVELPSEQFSQPDMSDVTPRRPSLPASPPAPARRSVGPPRGSEALGVDPRSVNIPPSICTAEQRRTQRFHDDEWGSPADHPLRYPKGNRHGW